MKIFYLSLFSEFQHPKRSYLISIIYTWHKSTMLETNIKEFPVKPVKISHFSQFLYPYIVNIIFVKYVWLGNPKLEKEMEKFPVKILKAFHFPNLYIQNCIMYFNLQNAMLKVENKKFPVKPIEISYSSFFFFLAISYNFRNKSLTCNNNINNKVNKHIITYLQTIACLSNSFICPWITYSCKNRAKFSFWDQKSDLEYKGYLQPNHI